MITGKLNIGVEKDVWRGINAQPNLFVLEFLEDDKLLFMNNEAIKGLSKNDLRKCLYEVINILEEVE